MALTSTCMECQCCRQRLYLPFHNTDPLNIFLAIFISFTFILLERQRDRERFFLSVGSLIRHLGQLRLSPAETRSLELHPSLTWVPETQVLETSLLPSRLPVIRKLGLQIVLGPQCRHSDIECRFLAVLTTAPKVYLQKRFLQNLLLAARLLTLGFSKADHSNATEQKNLHILGEQLAPY